MGLAKPTAPAYFSGVKLMSVGVVNFGYVQLLRFVVLKKFWSCSNSNFGHIDSVILIRLFKLASFCFLSVPVVTDVSEISGM